MLLGALLDAISFDRREFNVDIFLVFPPDQEIGGLCVWTMVAFVAFIIVKGMIKRLNLLFYVNLNFDVRVYKNLKR